MKRLLNKDEIKYKKEEIKSEAKTNEQGFIYGKGITKNDYGKGIPGSYLRRRGGK